MDGLEGTSIENTTKLFLREQYKVDGIKLNNE